MSQAYFPASVSAPVVSVSPAEPEFKKETAFTAAEKVAAAKGEDVQAAYVHQRDACVQPRHPSMSGRHSNQDSIGLSVLSTIPSQYSRTCGCLTRTPGSFGIQTLERPPHRHRLPTSDGLPPVTPSPSPMTHRGRLKSICQPLLVAR